eukprot:1160660-Pelagomonas_calceolata.AAC.7
MFGAHVAVCGLPSAKSGCAPSSMWDTLSHVWSTRSSMWATLSQERMCTQQYVGHSQPCLERT